MRGETLELRTRDARQVELVAHAEAQLEKLRAKAVTTAWDECQVPTVGERGREAMCRAPREPEAVGQIAERNRPLGDELDHIQSAKQCLAAEARRLLGLARHACSGLGAHLRCSSHYVVPVLVCGTRCLARNECLTVPPGRSNS